MAPVQDGRESDASMRARLVESLSNSFPGSALSKALHFMDADIATGANNPDRLSLSCFAELCLDKPATPDDELTNLEWLQSHDLLKNIETGDRTLCTSPTAEDDVQKENDVLGPRGRLPQVPYNPQKHVTSKPPYSFSCLIFMAIEEAPTKRLPVKDIYDWVQVNFPYFRNAPTGWKNSVRHNLSLNKCFMKVEKDRGQGIGKGSYWCVDPNFRPNLLQALRRTPYHPYHQMQMVSSGNTHGLSSQVVHSLRNSFNDPSPHLFPFLSQRLSQTKVADSSDIDVANALVQLKRSAFCRRPLHCVNGWEDRSRSPSPSEYIERQKRTLRRKLRAGRCHSPVVCTMNPSADHTYSLTDDQIQEALLLSPSSSSVDEDYNFISDIDDDDFDDDVIDDFDEGDEEENLDFSPVDTRIKKSGVDFDAPHQFSSNQRRENEAVVEKKVVVHPKNSVVTRSMTSRLKRKCPEADDEEMKIREGADALMNLAGLMSPDARPEPGSAKKTKNAAISKNAAVSKNTAVSKKRSGLRIRLRKRSCKRSSPRSKSTCNNNNNNSSNSQNNKNRRRSSNKLSNNNNLCSSNNNVKKDVDGGVVQVKTECEDILVVKIKEELIDDD